MHTTLLDVLHFSQGWDVAAFTSTSSASDGRSRGGGIPVRGNR